MSTIAPASLCQQLLSADRRACDLVAGLTEGQAAWRPEPSVLSIRECLSRMRRSAEQGLASLDAGLERAPRVPRRERGSREVGWLWVACLEAWESVSWTPGHDTADDDLPVRQVLGAVLRAHSEVRDRLAELFCRDLGVTASSLVGVPLGVRLAAIPVGARRQLRCAERLRLHPRFPDR